MDALRARFGERLLDDLDQLGRALNGRDREAMHRIAHRMSGAAGMFGYPQLSAKGAALEDAIDRNRPDEEVAEFAAALMAEIAGFQNPLPPLAQ